MKNPAPAKTTAQSMSASSAKEMIEARTINVFTLRKTQDFDESMQAIHDDIASLGLKSVDIVRHITLYLSLLPTPELFNISRNLYKDSSGKAKSSTTFGINKATHIALDKAIDEINLHAKASNFKWNADKTNLVTQGVYHFENLSRSEKLDAIRSVKREFGEILHYLTPKQAESAIELL